MTGAVAALKLLNYRRLVEGRVHVWLLLDANQAVVT